LEASYAGKIEREAQEAKEEHREHKTRRNTSFMTKV